MSVEGLWVRHVIARVHARRDIESLLANTEVCPQIGRHLIKWLEEAWEDAAPGANDRIARVCNVELRLACVEVEGRLHAVTDVVDWSVETGARERRIERLRVRESPAQGVSVHHVAESAVFTDHKVWVAVPAHKWRERADPLANRAPPEQLALGGDLVADQEVEISEACREEESVGKGAERDAVLTAPACGGVTGDHAIGIDLAFTDWVVKLWSLCPNNDPVVIKFTEVNARFADHRCTICRDGRDVTDDQTWEAARADFGNRDHGHTDTVCEGDPAIHPGCRLLRAIWIQLTCGEHDESLLTINAVAVNIHVSKVVVLANRLQLIERLLQRSVIPKAGVCKRLSIRGDRVCGEGSLAVVLQLAPAIKAEGETRHLQVIGNVRLLKGELVRQNLEALHELRIEPAEHAGGTEPDQCGEGEWPDGARQGGTNQECGGDRGDRREDVQPWELRGVICV